MSLDGNRRVAEIDNKLRGLGNNLQVIEDIRGSTSDPARITKLDQAIINVNREISVLKQERTAILQRQGAQVLTAQQSLEAGRAAGINPGANDQIARNIERLQEEELRIFENLQKDPSRISPMPAPIEVTDQTVVTVDLTGGEPIIREAPTSPTPVFRRVIPQDDWRARITLAPSANYLYKSQDPGILAPLINTDGVLFPYTPHITTMYTANYATKQMPHSNWMGKFYQGSNVGEITLQASFTAQDENEARYLLAVLTFFKAASKMFYGQDFERGAPPPVLYLSAFGEYQYNYAPVLLHQFTLDLPKDVDYIRTSASEVPELPRVEAQPWRFTNPFTSTMARLARAGLKKGGDPAPVEERTMDRAPLDTDSSDVLGDFIASNFGREQAPAPVVERSFESNEVNGITYVPTKVDITLMLHPLQSRAQMSQEFSLRDFANGKLIKRGFW